MKLYKLTDADMKTRVGEYNETQWGEGVSHTARRGEGKLCSEFLIHAYEDPYVAVFLYPIHSPIENPILWEAQGKVDKRDGQLKCGCKKLKTIRQIPLPEITILQRVEIAILCARIVYHDKSWVKWANEWLSGKDRSSAAAIAAAAAAIAAAAAAIAAAGASANAAHVATIAAGGAAIAAAGASANAAHVATIAANAAANAAHVAAYTAYFYGELDLIAIIKWVVERGELK